jgi:hypothetical protein
MVSDFPDSPDLSAFILQKTTGDLGCSLHLYMLGLLSAEAWDAASAGRLVQ